MNNKQIAQLVKQVAGALREFEELTKAEIEIMKKEINLKFQNTDLNYERLEKITQSLELKLKEINKGIHQQSDQNDTKPKFTQIQRYFIHNQSKFKNGLAKLKIDEDKYVRVTLIPRYKYNKYTGKWTKKYFVQSMTE